ncbi:hypothetical protein D3C87_102480 [compost metagenome]
MRTFLFVFILLPLLAKAEEGVWTERVKSFLPNTIVFDIARNQSEIRLDGRESLTTENQPISSSGDFSNVFNAISITSMPSHEESMGFRFEWTPVFTFAFNNLKFNNSAAFINDTDFQIFRTSLGIGPQLGYKTSLGTLYVNLTPGIAYSWVSWSSPASGGSMARTNGNLAFSVGYFNYFTPQWALRLFVKQVYEDTKVWNEALDSSQGFDIPVKEVINKVVGGSLCYVF